jgi:hypothetical protein
VSEHINSNNHAVTLEENGGPLMVRQVPRSETGSGRSIDPYGSLAHQPFVFDKIKMQKTAVFAGTLFDTLLAMYGL